MKLKAEERSETEIQTEILEGLNRILPKSSFNRINNGAVYDPKMGLFRKPSKFQPNGMSDINGSMQGQACYIEVKTSDEYNKVIKFFSEVSNNGQDLDLLYVYKPEKKSWEERAINQIIFILGKKKTGAKAFFTYSLEHALARLRSDRDEI